MNSGFNKQGPRKSSFSREMFGIRFERIERRKNFSTWWVWFRWVASLGQTVPSILRREYDFWADFSFLEEWKFQFVLAASEFYLSIEGLSSFTVETWTQSWNGPKGRSQDLNEKKTFNEKRTGTDSVWAARREIFLFFLISSVPENFHHPVLLKSSKFLSRSNDLKFTSKLNSEYTSICGKCFGLLKIIESNWTWSSRSRVRLNIWHRLFYFNY